MRYGKNLKRRYCWGRIYRIRSGFDLERNKWVEQQQPFPFRIELRIWHCTFAKHFFVFDVIELSALPMNASDIGTIMKLDTKIERFHLGLNLTENRARGKIILSLKYYIRLRNSWGWDWVGFSRPRIIPGPIQF